MEFINQILNGALPDSFDPGTYFLSLLITVVSIFLVAGIFRLWLGEGSVVNKGICSGIAIVCIYAIILLINKVGPNFRILFSPLPFVSVSDNALSLFPVLKGTFYDICTHCANTLILAYLINILDIWLPEGRKFWSWYGFRFLSMAIAISVHYSINLFLHSILQQSTLKIIPLILLATLLTAFLLACLKRFVGGSLAFLEGFLGLFHTFFFKQQIGKQLLRAMVTTLVITGTVCVLNYFSITGIAFASVAILTYLPFLIVGLIAWYVIDKYL